MAGERKTPELIDHIGWDLWRATDAWTRRFTDEMVSRGFIWFGEARGGLVQHIGRNGLPQAGLAQKAGLSKQAVQQQLDDLVADGVVARVSDPGDARRKLIQLTPEGLRAFEVANTIKRAIEKDYRRLLGDQAFESMKRALGRINEGSR